MSVTFEQIILDAKRIANRLKDREALGDSLLLESESVNKQIESMRQFQDDIDILNKLARERSNNQLITIIHQENPQIREIQQENRLLKAALEDHQHALEHIMSKYREHTQSKILNTKVNFVEAFSKHQQFTERKDEVIRQQTQKIQEMAAVMQRASQMDEEKFHQEQEFLSKLITENKGSASCWKSPTSVLGLLLLPIGFAVTLRENRARINSNEKGDRYHSHFGSSQTVQMMANCACEKNKQ
ncbi:hypothetical protein pipiens_005655 [Culex pipiens pipiens]|uniref:Uncharacterized protein n=1 Tax=Culex pipiens pipiens TaxID=38569 RepID=A0ABD1DUZ0_CULPP